MGFRTGIVGLPNVGKSTLFNALTRTAAAQAANFPFCTIEPNVGEVAVPDARLEQLAAIANSKQMIPTRMTFVDIAGLVKGASKGEGLGNQFLANIREVDAIAHVLRCFEDGDVTHVEGRVDPVADAETIETELMLADLESIEKRRTGLVRKLKGGDKEAVQQDRLLAAAQLALEEGRPARTVEVAAEDEKAWTALQLLTTKPVLYVCNVAEDQAASGNEHSRVVQEMAEREGAAAVVISARIEEEIAQLEPEEQALFLEELGLEEAGLAHRDNVLEAQRYLLGEVLAVQSEQQIGDDCDIDLDQNRIAALAEEPLDFEVLLDPFEQQFDVPASLVKSCDFSRCCIEHVTQNQESFTLAARMADLDKAQRMPRQTIDLACTRCLVGKCDNTV